MSASGSLLNVDRRVRSAVRDAPESRLHSVGDTRREHIGPLDDRLVRHTDRVGGGSDRTPQKFDCLCFEHAALNHSSESSATIVRAPLRMLSTMVEYRQRFIEAMRLSGKTEKEIAAELGVKVQAISKVVAGKTKEMMCGNNAKAARFMQVDADWLAIGTGQARSERVWPYARLTVEAWAALSAETRLLAENMLLSVVPPIKRRETVPIVDSGPRHDALHRSAAQKQTRSSKGKRKG